MIRMRDEPAVDDIGVPLSDAQICEHVLGKRSGYIKGLGYGPKPTSKSSSVDLASQRESGQLREELQGTREQLDNTLKLVETQQIEIDLLKENQRRVEELLKSVVPPGLFGSFAPGHHASSHCPPPPTPPTSSW